jgi:nucleotide-binding universal stress UspA family protein
MGGLIIGVDESEHAARALRWGAREAELHAWPAIAVMAWGLLDQHRTMLGERFDPTYGDKHAAEALDGIVTGALGDAQAERVERRVVCDLPARALLDESVGAELLVVGARGIGGFKGLLLGSVSQQCLHHAAVPVAVVRQRVAPEPGRAERVLVAVDGSDTAARALAWALGEARLRDAQVTVLHAWHQPFVGGYPYTEAVLDPAANERASRQLVGDALDSADTTGLAAPVEVKAVAGGAAKLIVDAAESADLVVMGSRGLGGFKGLLLGSVTTHVARHATCTVVVIPARD